MSRPKVSVCLPVFNGEAYIAESIESVIGQTYSNFELIVSDNRSTDGTSRLVTGFKDERIRFYRNPKNVGLVANFNRCISLATGDYLCMWSHDDIMLPRNLELKVRLLDENRSVGFVHSNCYLVKDDGSIRGEHWAVDSRRDYLASGRAFLRTLLEGNAVCLPSALVRRECFDKVGGYDARLPFTCDFHFWLRVSLFYDVACLAEPLVKFRRHAQSITDSQGFRGYRGLAQDLLARRLLMDQYRPDMVSETQAFERTFRLRVERAVESGIRKVVSRDVREAVGYFAVAVNTDFAYTVVFLSKRSVARLRRTAMSAK